MKVIACAATTASALLLALPAVAATPPVVKGTVGPGFTISLAKKPTKAGKVKFTIADRSSIHNFHLIGGGAKLNTGVGATGTKTYTVTLKKGTTYRFVCDPHASTMKGSFKIAS